MSIIEQVLEQNKKIWSGLVFWQKMTLIGVAVIALASIIILLVLANSTTYEPLYADLDPRDASAIVAKLKELKVDYKLADEGKTILVAAEDKYQLRLDMAGEINLQGVVGFESFNETRFGETDTDKRVRFLVALQGELARTIEEIDEVEKAKVHIALPQPSLFIKDQKEPTASVLLRMKPYAALKPEQINSIIAFVSHSVEGLKAQNVTIIDVNGNLLSDAVSTEGKVLPERITITQLALKNQYEQDLARSIQSMLEKMWGQGKAVVRANVSLDFDQVETFSEKYGDAVLASEQVKEESSIGAAAFTGGNPADENMGQVSYGGVENNGSTQYELTERIRNYEISKITETKIAAPGRVTKVSVSVLLDGELSEEERAGISDIVGKAAGIDASRGDQVAIVAMPFNTEETRKLEEQMAAAERAEAIREYIRYGLYALGMLLALGLIYALLRGMKNMAVSSPLIPSVAATASSSAPVQPEINISLSPEALEKKMLREHIENLVATNPEDVARVIKTWLAEE